MNEVQDGRKYDEGKTRYNLLDYTFVEGIAEVLTFGAQKYDDADWTRVPDKRERYFAALMRHVIAWRKGERFDQETKLHHLHHAACCLMFLVWFENNEGGQQ